jgi:conserved hypothetical protein, YceG family
MKRKKIVIIVISVLLLLFVVAGVFVYSVYKKVNSPAFPSDALPVMVYIDSQRSYSSLLNQLSEQQINDLVLFQRLAKQMKYPENIKTGRFEFAENISYLNLVRALRSWRQPIIFTFNNVRFKEDLAKRAGEEFMFSADDLLTLLNDETYCQKQGFDTLTIIAMFIPNTYEMYWDIDAGQFTDKMKTEYNRFWNSDRLAKAEAIGLSPVDVSTLASIVEEETAKLDEYPVVAGLYINRLHKGMLLQADPTVKYAVGDVTLQRVLNRHLEVDSPYNTYKHTGLPPGPIRIPSIQGIDAVLNYTKHDYLYMCAKEDFSGYHNFSRTLSEHNRNARKYQQALNRLNIR